MDQTTKIAPAPVLDYRQKGDDRRSRRAWIGATITVVVNVLGVLLAGILLIQVPGSGGWDRFALTISVAVVGVVQFVVTISPTVIYIRSRSLPRGFKRLLWISMAAGLALSLASYVLCIASPRHFQGW